MTQQPARAVVGLLDRDAELLHLPLPHEKVMYLLAATSSRGSAGASEVPTGLSFGDGDDVDDGDRNQCVNNVSMCGRLSCGLTLFLTSPGTRGRGLVQPLHLGTSHHHHKHHTRMRLSRFLELTVWTCVVWVMRRVSCVRVRGAGCSCRARRGYCGSTASVPVGSANAGRSDTSSS